MRHSQLRSTRGNHAVATRYTLALGSMLVFNFVEFTTSAGSRSTLARRKSATLAATDPSYLASSLFLPLSLSLKPETPFPL